MSYQERIQSILYNDAAVQAAVSSFVQSSTTIYMIWNYTLLPTKITTDSNSDYELTVQDKTINHYTSSPVSGSSPIVQTVQTVSCRAYTEDDAAAISTAVYNALNKVRSADGCSLFVCTKNPIIPPSGSDDNYNSQIFVSVKSGN